MGGLTRSFLGFSVGSCAEPTLRAPLKTRRTQLTICRARADTLLEYTNLMGVIRLAALLILLAASCLAQNSNPGLPVPRFEDVSKEAGLTVSHDSTPEKRYILESMSGGVGFIDCDNDGKLDIVTVNGSSVDHYRQGGDPMVTLYHQDADLKFSNITKDAGLTIKGWGMRSEER